MSLSIVATKRFDDGVTIECNHCINALRHYGKDWFDNVGIPFPTSVLKFVMRFQSEADATLFWLAFAGKTNYKVSGSGEEPIPFMQHITVNTDSFTLLKNF